MRIAVYGIGNVLRSDDGFGPSAVDRLGREWDLGEGIVLRDLGTPGLDLASHLVELDRILFFDALEMDGAPGSIHVFDGEAITSQAPQGWRTSTHQAGLRESLWVAEALRGAPVDVRLIGVVPQDLGTGAGLSPAVESAVDEACAVALRQLEAWGARPRRARAARPADAWWEKVS